MRTSTDVKTMPENASGMSRKKIPILNPRAKNRKVTDFDAAVAAMENIFLPESLSLVLDLESIYFSIFPSRKETRMIIVRIAILHISFPTKTYSDD